MRRCIVLTAIVLILSSVVSFADVSPEAPAAVPEPQKEKNVLATEITAPLPLPSNPSKTEEQNIQLAPEVPDDPCLPPLYKDWQEMSLDNPDRYQTKYIRYRILIDKSAFQLVFEGIRRDRVADTLYTTHVGLGDVRTPTPDGRFIINHVYCYPDVLFFDASAEKISGLYNGFFAPLLECDNRGHCKRFRDMGVHGYRGSGPTFQRATYGAISAGCIRLPDPCRFKSELIRYVGIGPMKKNDRGTYHWLNKPVEVVISDAYPGEEQLTIVSTLQQGLDQIGDGLRSLFGIAQ